ncbi:unnamed protein product, partial [Didymodactylos carnosus]
MAPRLWHECSTCNTENDLKVFVREKNICTHRTEELRSGVSITYKCSEYREYPQCRYQLKAKQLDGKFTVFESELHDHSQRQENNRLKSPIRAAVQEMTHTGLTQGQIRKAVSVLHPNLSIDTKIKNVVQYTRQQTRTQIISVDDLQLWCKERINCSPADQLHQVFVPFYEVKDIDNIFVRITTRQLLSTTKCSSVLAVDCTYKVAWNNLPILIFGTSDYKRHFHPIGLCLVSSDEAASTYKTLFQGVPTWASNINQQTYLISHVMGDGAAGITSTMSVIPRSRRLMCWAHMIRKCREHRKLIPNEQKRLNVEKDIVNLQLCFQDNLFSQAASLLLGKWSLDNQLDRFRTYFEGQWINDLSFWYEGAVCLAPSTNNGLESLNGKIKQSYTMRNKLSLATFLQTAERMLRDWSTKSATDGFAHTIHFESDLESKAHQWSQKIDQSQIIRLSNTGYVIPTTNSTMNTN